VAVEASIQSRGWRAAYDNALRSAAGLACLLLTILVAAPSAEAGTFSRLRRLPSGHPERWSFATNDQGAGVAAREVGNGVLVYPVSRSGHLGRPRRWALPSEPVMTSIALDDRGRVALASVFLDGTFLAEEEHQVSCCERVAAASWRLGTAPPVAQVLTPAKSQYNETSEPQLVLAPHSVTIVWVGGPNQEPGFPEPEATLEEAYGTVGSRLRVRKMMRAPEGIPFLHLSLDSSRVPVASWLDDVDKVYSVRATHDGALPRPRQPQTITSLREGHGFTSDPEGDTTFAYLADGRLRIITSHDGGRFGHDRIVGEGIVAVASAYVVTGPGRSLLVLWEPSTRHHETTGSYFGRTGTLFGRLSAPMRLGSEARAFIGRLGESVVLYESTKAERERLVAVTAPRDLPFGTPETLSPVHRNCVLEPEEPLVPFPLPVTSNGHALFGIGCEGGELAYMRSYRP
jgi:hypothetical protein